MKEESPSDSSCNVVVVGTGSSLGKADRAAAMAALAAMINVSNGKALPNRKQRRKQAALERKKRK